MEAARIDERLPRHVFRYCEGELYRYHLSRAKLADLRAAIIDGRAIGDSGPVSHGPGDTTSSRVLRLVSDREIARLERITRAIEQTYRALTDEHRKVIHVKYWRGRDINGADLGYGDRVEYLTNAGLAQLIDLSPRTFDRRRHEIVEALAYMLDA